MGKLHCDHRVVLRDQHDTIISDQPFESFAKAKPVFDDRCEDLEDGQELTLQHGARIIYKAAKRGVSRS